MLITYLRDDGGGVFTSTNLESRIVQGGIPNRTYDQTVVSSMNKVRIEYITTGFEDFDSVQTILMPVAQLPDWETFRDNVGTGFRFSFDALGTVASPDSPVNVYLVSNSLRFTRGGSGNRYFSAAFQLRLDQ